MPEVFTTPGDMRDGCGPYGRHLRGSTNWQKYRAMSNQAVNMLGYLMLANQDIASAVPPPSEDFTISSLRCYVLTQGTSSFIRMALYNAEDMANLLLVVDSGELASDTNAAFVDIACTATLRRNARYLMMACARGVVLPTIYCCSNVLYSATNWLGNDPVVVGAHLSRIIYTRANAAFPAAYNGVFSSVDGIAPVFDAKLP
jgi:hypothetical protein